MASPAEAAIIAGIEKRKGPVGKGHHNSHRTTALLAWLKQQEKKHHESPANPNSAAKKAPAK